MATIEKRTTQDKQTSFRVKVRLTGFPTQTATFSRLTDAKKWAQQTEAAIREGRYFKSAESKKHSLANAIDRYIKNVLPRKPKAIRDQTTQLNWWKEQIGQHTLASITPALISEYRDKLANTTAQRGDKKCSPATVNRYMAALSHLFTIAMKEWGWVEDNPFRKVTKLKEPRGRVRYLSEEERGKFLDACRNSSNSYLYPVVVLALSVGARKMEILGLKWDDIDLNRGLMTFHQTKNGERRSVPLTGLALNLIKEMTTHRNDKAPLVFPSEHNPTQPIDIRQPFEAALKKAGINGFRFHDLRHSTASYLAMNGASLAEIAEVLGHKTLQMVKRYAHLSEAHTLKVVASMNERIFGNAQEK